MHGFVIVILKETLRSIVKSQKGELDTSEYGIERVLAQKIEVKLRFVFLTGKVFVVCALVMYCE